MNAQLNQQPGTEFKREQRYYVLKLSDLHGTVGLADLLYLDGIARKVADRRAQEGKEQREYLVIESDWPEFEPTWRGIEARVSGVPQQPPQLEVAGWRPKFPERSTSLPPSSFNAGMPDQTTVDYWKAQGVEIEYCYTGPAPELLDIDDLRDRLVAISSAVAHGDDRDAQSMLGEAIRLLANHESVEEPIKYHPGEWYEAKDRNDLEAFFRSRLPAIREAAREHGYAIGLHGSLRRDLDLIAASWRDGASDKDVLAHAIAMAACGITREGPYQWEAKPLGRMAASLPCCWTSWHGEAGAGHIDLSVTPSTEPARVSMAWPEARDIGRYGDMHPMEHMRVGLDSDNDVYVSVWGEDGGARVEFCNPGGGGGGSSRRTREALIALMIAMEADNAERPDKDWWARRSGSARAKGDAA